MSVNEIEVDVRYLQEEGVFETCSYGYEWPRPASKLIARRAATLNKGSRFSGLPIHGLMILLGGFITSGTKDALTMRLELERVDGQLLIDMTVISRGLVMPPIESDNVGFFEYALGWFAAHEPIITLGVCGRGLFWIHQQRKG